MDNLQSKPLISIQLIRPDTHSLDEVMKHLSADGWEDEGHTEDPANLKRYIEDPDCFLLLAYVNGEVAGMLTAYLHKKTDERGQEMYVDEVETKAAFRRQGVARSMMQHIMEIAREHVCSELWVATETDNDAANALYAGLSPSETEPSVAYIYRL